jgi:tetratricopeptide (TPR) repeat protein
MKSISTLAMGVALALGAVSLAAPVQAAAKEAKEAKYKPKFSKEAQPKLAALQKAMAGTDEAAYQAALAAAKAAVQNADDKFVLGQFQLNHAIKANDDAEKLVAIEMMIQSGAASQEDLGPLYQNLGGLAFNAKDYPKAEAAFRKQLELQPSNPEAMNNLAAALIQQKKTGEAVGLVEQRIAAAKAANQPVEESVYKQALGLAYESGSPRSVELSRDLVAAYPSPENWRNALVIYRELKNPTGDANLDFLRLMRVTKSLDGERNYYELADAANMKGLPGEAKAVLDEGVAAKAFDPNKAIFKELIASTGGKIKEDRASLAALETEARAAASGTLALNTGDAYFGYGDYAKAVELYKLAMQKGNVDASLANSHLGMAYALAGQKAEAEAAFKAVTGPRTDLASYWLLWLSQRG